LIDRVHWIAETVFVLHPSEFLAVEYLATAARDEVVHSLLAL